MRIHSYTIVTVMMGEHLSFLEYMVDNFSDAGLTKWYIVNNQPEVDVSSLSASFVEILEGTSNPYPKVTFGAGVHHSEGLKLAISRVKTPWVVIIDPDFFLLDYNTINKIIDVAENENKLLIGTPWFPTWIGKRINCIALHFAVAKTSIFHENFEWYPIKELNQSNLEKKMTLNETSMIRKVSKIRIIKFLYTLTIRRFKINKLLDTAASLESHYQTGNSKFLEIGITSKQSKQIIGCLPAKFWIFLERKLPRRISYFPNPTKLIKLKVPKSLEFAEHFNFNDEVLGFHLRSFGNRLNNTKSDDKMSEIREYIQILKGIK